MGMYGDPFGPDLFSSMFFLVFFLILGVIVFNIFSGIKQWSYNNTQPVLDVKCKVVTKRTSVSRSSGHTDANGHHHSGHTSTSYYITFEFSSGDRTEFNVSGRDYGMIAEGDFGTLKFQGTRFLEFLRNT